MYESLLQCSMATVQKDAMQCTNAAKKMLLQAPYETKHRTFSTASLVN